MNICITLVLISLTLISAQDIDDKSSEVNLKKRNLEELSYSFAATDIGSKSGTRIKTITVIKNKKHRTLKINPELHKNEDWGSEFRDNYDKYGNIPKLPEIFIQNENQQSSQEISTEKTPRRIVFRKESIPIYEEPDEEPESISNIPFMESNTKIPADVTQQIQVEMIRETPQMPADKQIKNNESIKLASTGSINMKQAEQIFNPRDLRFENDRTQQEKHRNEYVQRSLLQEYLRSLKLPLNNYKFKPREIRIENSYPDSVYTAHQQMSTTTVPNPYTAPIKKAQVLPSSENSQDQKVPWDVDTDTESSVRKIFTAKKSGSAITDSKPALTADSIRYYGTFSGL